MHSDRGFRRLKMNIATKCLLASVIPACWSSVASAAAEGAAEPQLFTGGKEGLVVALTTLVVFVLLVAVLGRFAWGPIASGLKAREDRIRKDIADAEATRARAEATLREYQAQLTAAEARVRQMLNDAAAQGERLATDIRLRGQQEAEEIKNRATREINAAREQALAEIYQRSAELSTAIAEKILRRSINAEDQRDLVDRSLAELQTVGPE
jgi:F-type H+-transporting ATPase subunit b